MNGNETMPMRPACLWAALVVAGMASAGLAQAVGDGPAAAATQPASQPATRPAPDDANAGSSALIRKVLADPLNAAALDELAAARRRQEARTAAGYESLVQGLRAYLELGPELALPALEKAAQSDRAASLTASMTRPLDLLLPRLREQVKAASSGKSGPCSRCGDTGQDDCRAHRCYGSGRVPCESCKGMGTQRRELPGLGQSILVICPDCGGAGVVACDGCRGSGVVPCSACGKAAGDPRPPRLPVAEQQEVRRVIDQARWLRSGGLDLYTAGALRPTPK